MEDIGATLCQAREQLGLTLDEVERAIRIRARHLQALEGGDLDGLPSPVQARGFLHNYAEFLGLNAEELLLRYAETLQARRKKASLGRTPTTPTVVVRRRRPAWMTVDVLVAVVLVTAVIALFVWGTGRVMAALREQTQAASLGVEATPSASPAPAEEAALPAEATGVVEQGEVAPLAEGPALSPTPPIIIGALGQVDIRLVVERRAWVRVLVDGRVAYSGRVTPGEVLSYQGEDSIEVLTGNAAGLRILYNGEDQGLLGDFGQVVARIWTRQGVVLPTPSPSPSPAPTQPPSATPSTPPTQAGT
jgi:cytoskeleton protein RodZ